jgi:hypothetical protein
MARVIVYPLPMSEYEIHPSQWSLDPYVINILQSDMWNPGVSGADICGESRDDESLPIRWTLYADPRNGYVGYGAYEKNGNTQTPEFIIFGSYSKPVPFDVISREVNDKREVVKAKLESENRKVRT